MRLKTIEPLAEIGRNVKYAAALLSQGKVVGIPTDTVYGVACNALDPQAIDDIFHIKERTKDKPLIAQTSSLKKATSFLQFIPIGATKLANKYWPGALTMVFEANDNIPKNMISGGDTIGVRVPDHAMALELLKTLDFPLAVTSANKSGMQSPKTAKEVNEQIGDRIDYILDGGPSAIGIESTIIGFADEKPVILRAGAISEKEIFDTLNIK